MINFKTKYILNSFHRKKCNMDLEDEYFNIINNKIKTIRHLLETLFLNFFNKLSKIKYFIVNVFTIYI